MNLWWLTLIIPGALAVLALALVGGWVLYEYITGTWE